MQPPQSGEDPGDSAIRGVPLEGVKPLGVYGLIGIVVWIAFCFYLMVLNPGLGIVLLVLSVPPLIRTSLVVANRRRFGMEVDNYSRIVLYVSSIAILAMVLLVVGVCVLVGVFIGCIVSVSLGSYRDPEAGMLLGGGVGLLLALVPSILIIVARWRIDTRR